jgi:hypothetical protein
MPKYVKNLHSLVKNFKRTRENDRIHHSAVLQATIDKKASERGKWLSRRHPCTHEQLRVKELQRKTVRQWFDFIDADGSGEIDLDELEDPLISMGLAHDKEEVRNIVVAVTGDPEMTSIGAVFLFLSFLNSKYNYVLGFDQFNELVSGSGSTSDAANPIIKLYTALTDGSLGDKSLNIGNLIAAYR